MTIDPTTLRTQWIQLRETEKGLHALEQASRLGVTEGELLASACGALTPVSATRIEADWPAFIAKLPRLGRVKTVSRTRTPSSRSKGRTTTSSSSARWGRA